MTLLVTNAVIPVKMADCKFDSGGPHFRQMATREFLEAPSEGARFSLIDVEETSENKNRRDCFALDIVRRDRAVSSVVERLVYTQ
jgi:hypothetical protein